MPFPLDCWSLVPLIISIAAVFLASNSMRVTNRKSDENVGSDPIPKETLKSTSDPQDIIIPSSIQVGECGKVIYWQQY